MSRPHSSFHPRRTSPPPTRRRAAPGNRRRSFRPKLLPDGGVTFRLRAPKATEVKVAGQFGPDAAMTKDNQGVWSVTVPSVPAGVHEYHFVVDGLNVIDPQNSAVKPQRWPARASCTCPRRRPRRGICRTFRTARSTSTPTSRRRSTSGGASSFIRRRARSRRPLPVLYLAHGFSDNEATWTVHGKAHWILDYADRGEKGGADDRRHARCARAAAGSRWLRAIRPGQLRRALPGTDGGHRSARRAAPTRSQRTRARAPSPGFRWAATTR